MVDPFGTVFAARGGAGSPIPNATVLISLDQEGNNLLPVPQGQGFEPNLENTNPYASDSQGRFSFGLLPNQLGTTGSPAVYYITVNADGFRSRLLQVTLEPTSGGLFKMTVKSLDGMPLAVADGFELVQNDVEINSIADIAFNIPLFETSALDITKRVDRDRAEIGDILTYRIDVHNATVAPLLNTVVTDTLPNSFNYVSNTAQVTRQSTKTPLEPSLNGNTMTFNLGTVASGERLTISYRVRIGVNAGVGESFNSATGRGNFASGETITTPATRVGVKVGGGVFSMKQFIIGRVFVDENNNHSFDAGEKPIVGARVYLADGQSVLTDSQGLYNLPAVSEGAQVVGIDPITLPQGYLLADNEFRSEKSWTRLLRTPLGGGAMLRQNFILVPSKTNPPIAAKELYKDVEASNQPKQEEPRELKTADIMKEMIGGQTVPVVYSKSESAKPAEFKPIKLGSLEITSIEDNQLIMAPAFNLDVSVAQNWKAKLELNGKVFADENIGLTREDKKNKIVSYSFIGLILKPGPNQISVTTYNENQTGETATINVYGRGPAKKLEIISDKREIQASGRDSTRLVVKAFDQWGNPAQDDLVMIQTSAGSLITPDEYAQNRQAARNEKIVIGEGLTSTGGIGNEQSQELTRQQKIKIKNGIGLVRLLSDTKIGVAKINGFLGESKAETNVQFVSELRPQILVGLAEATFGKNAPEMQNRGVEESFRPHLQFFYRGALFGSENMLTLAYDSQQPLNRLAGRDRMFQLNPLDRVYPVFGDSSTRFQETESNSKVYARLDRGRSYGLFGDFTADMETNRLTAYTRKLTGGKIHLENSNGDFVTVTGARPDTSYARQIIPGGTLSIVQLAYPDIMPGSEVLTIETRDRRNPEVILTREPLTRGIDYNMDPNTGTIFFLRPIYTFDRELNLIQVVATYEYRSNGLESSVYTARASKNLPKLGLRFGGSYIDQRQADSSPFRLMGLDLDIKLPKNGKLFAEWAMSRGVLNNGFNFFGNTPNSGNQYNGNAFFLSLEQPLPVLQSSLHFEGSTSSRNFYNPFGATTTPGNTRGALTVEMKPSSKGNLKLNLIEERNSTENVDNNRVTVGALWTQTLNEKIKVGFGYDFRHFTDNANDKTISSSLITVLGEYKPTQKMSFSIKREQNLGEEDPSFPNQTTISADYLVSNETKVFFTQRLASNTIRPISDISATGFAESNARNETAIGVETKYGKYTSFSGRYQIENGINGTDSFAVAGLQNRLPVNKKLSFDLGYERAFHLAGNGKSYNNFLVGMNYLPNDNLKSSFRYEIRDRNGFGQVLSFGVAGQLKKGWTALGRFQYGDISFDQRTNRVSEGQATLAIRPHDTDKYGFLFSYQRQNSFYSDNTSDKLPNIVKSDIISADGFYQPARRLELYGRFALKFSGDGNSEMPYANNMTYLLQGRAQYRLSRYFDLAAENRYLYQPSSGSQKNWFGTEIGYWATPDLRLGAGYNFSRSQEPFGFNNNNIYNKNGVYFVISTKISRLFNLFGTKKDGLQYVDEEKTTK